MTFSAPALAAALAVWLLAPGSCWFDAGELAAAAVEPGVPHPSGFPAFVLAGHALARLPLANGALRAHLLGALAAVAAAWLWLRALGLHCENDEANASGKWVVGAQLVIGIFGATCVLLVLSPPAVWRHVVATEVYPLVWLVAAASLAVVVHLRGAQRLAAASGLVGLGVGVHAEAALLAGVAWLFALGLAWCERNAASPTVFRGLAWGFLLAVGATAGIAALPLVAATQPRFSWGDVLTLPALFDHLTGASIRHAFADRMGAELGLALVALGRLVARDAVWLLAPAAVGAVTLWRDHRRGLGVTLGLMATDAVYTAALNPMGLRDDQAGLVLLVGIGVLAAIGLQRLANWAGGRARFALLGLAVVVCVVSLARTLARQPTADLRKAQQLHDRLLRRAPPGALAVTASDHAGSGCTWLQAGEGARPDVACVPGVFARDRRMLRWLAKRTGSAGFDDAAVLAARGPGGDSADAGRFGARLLGAWLQPVLRERPVLWERGLAQEDAQIQRHLLPGWPWHTLAPAPVAAEELATRWRQVRAAIARVGMPGAPGERTPDASGWLANALGLLAGDALRLDPMVAEALCAEALRLSDAVAKVLNNCAVVRIERGNPEAALVLAEQALDREPLYQRAHRTAARAAVVAGNADKAVQHARAWIETAASGPNRHAWLAELAAVARPPLRDRLQALLP
jgi:hypothetical protein